MIHNFEEFVRMIYLQQRYPLPHQYICASAALMYALPCRYIDSFTCGLPWARICAMDCPEKARLPVKKAQAEGNEVRN
jgi:hypothetical protein